MKSIKKYYIDMDDYRKGEGYKGEDLQAYPSFSEAMANLVRGIDRRPGGYLCVMAGTAKDGTKVFNVNEWWGADATPEDLENFDEWMEWSDTYLNESIYTVRGGDVDEHKGQNTVQRMERSVQRASANMG